MLPGVWDLSLPTRDQTHTPCITRWISNHRTTRDISSKEKRRACHLRTQWRKRIRIYSATWRNYFSLKRGTKCIYVFGDLTKHRQQWFLRKRKPTKWALPAQLPAWSEFPGLSTAVEGRAGSRREGGLHQRRRSPWGAQDHQKRHWGKQARAAQRPCEGLCSPKVIHMH